MWKLVSKQKRYECVNFRWTDGSGRYISRRKSDYTLEISGSHWDLDATTFREAQKEVAEMVRSGACK